MNKKFLKYYMETEPEGTVKKYIFLVDNSDIAMNIVMSGYCCKGRRFPYSRTRRQDTF